MEKKQCYVLRMGSIRSRSLAEILEDIEPLAEGDLPEVPVQLPSGKTLKRSEQVSEFTLNNIGGNRLKNQSRIHETLRGYTDELYD